MAVGLVNSDRASASPLNVVVGITGGIAAYKAVNVIRELVLAGHDVHVVATDAALRFVGKPTLEAISRNPVLNDLYDGVAEVRHVAIGQLADVIVIAPATANTIAKLAAGLADDLLGNTVLASTAPLVLAPAMHTEMWQNPATEANIATLRERGVIIVGPASGQLTGTDSGPGRMEEPESIVAATLAAAANTPRSSGRQPASRTPDLGGMRILISAGGTREPVDPVRFLGNRSSGRQGVALAVAARARGAAVTLAAANLEIAAPEGMPVHTVGTAEQLGSLMAGLSSQFDVIIMAAAVADYRPAIVQDQKLKKDETGAAVTLDLVRNPDILLSLSLARQPGQVIVGFAAETERNATSLLQVARTKLARKKCDLLVVNRVGWSEGFQTEDNDVLVLDATGNIVLEAAGTKLSVANRILDLVAEPKK